MVLPGAALLSGADSAHGAAAAGASAALTKSSQPSSASPSTPHGFAAAGSNLSLPSGLPQLSNFTKAPAKGGLGSLSIPKVGPASTTARPFGDLVSYPNAQIFSDLSNASSTAVPVSPHYVTAPAPLGLTDFGVGTTGTYAYWTPSFRATVDLAAAPNVTAPTTQSVIDPSGAKVGLVGSPYEFSLQLNTVLTNVTIPGSNFGTFWSQNVVDVNGTAIHFVDDVWNYTAGSGGVFPIYGPPTILSGCGLTNVTPILEEGDGVYQCVGGSVTISASNYPLSIQLYNNASVNAADNDELVFGYHITGAGGLSASGVADTLVFNNPNGTAVPPAYPANFEVNGATYAPIGDALYDSEIVFGGPIGGANAVFRSLNGSLQLQESRSGSYKNVPSAYNFGADTGETAVGIAGYYTTNGVEEVNQGPSLLYGLWNGTAANSVASGDIQFKGTVSPDYGFPFVSNVVPGPDGTNLSWVPTTASGTFDSWLPPAIPASGGAYNTVLYAPNQTTEAGATFSTSQTDYAFPSSTHTDTIEAPLYMDGEAQAKSLATNVTGYTSGPYVFNALVVNLPLAFTHLNDYLYPSFVIFQAEDLKTTAVHVNATYEGVNTNHGELYTVDVGSSGWDFVAPAPIGPVGNFTQQFNIWASTNPKVTNETLYGVDAYPYPFDYASPSSGGGIFYFADTDALASNITSAYASWGVSNVLSHGTAVHALLGVDGGRGLSDIGSTKTVGLNLSAYEGVAAFVLGSTDPSFTYVNATYHSDGIVAGYPFYQPHAYVLFGAHDLSVKYLNATYYSDGAAETYSSGDVYTDTSSFAATAVIGGFTSGMTVDGVVGNYSVGLETFGANWTNASGVVMTGQCVYDCFAGGSVAIVGSNDTTLSSPTFNMVGTDFADGLVIVGSNHTTVTSPTFQLGFTYEVTGLELFRSNYTTISDGTFRMNYSMNGEFSESSWFSDGLFGDLDNYTNITGSTVVETVVLQYVTFCDDCAIAYFEFELGGLELEGSNFTSIKTTDLTQTERLANSSDIYEIDTGLTGIGLQEDNASTVSGTTVTQNLTVTDTDAYDSELDAGGILLIESNNTSIATTVDHESLFLNDVEFDEFEFETAAVAGGDSVATTITATTVSSSYRALNYIDSFDNEIREFGLDLAPMFRLNIVTLTFYGVPFWGFDAIYLEESEYVNVSALTVTNSSVGIFAEYVSWLTVTDLTASRYSIGVWLEDAANVLVKDLSLSWLSAGVYADDESLGVTVLDAKAVNVTTQSPWAPYFYYFWGFPVAVVTAEDSDFINVSNVVTLDYPAILYTYDVGGYYDEYAEANGIVATNLTATGGYGLAFLNETAYSLLTGLTATDVQIGLSLYETFDNSYNDLNISHAATYGIWGFDSEDSFFYALNVSTSGTGLALVDGSNYDQVWGSTFYNNVGYAIWLFDNYDDEIWGNSFIGNNGATTTYSPLHIQAYAGYSPSYYFYNYTTDTGNYWSDWHSYSSSGVLAPYYVGDGNYDLYPLGAPASGATVVFYESGLATGTTWSVTFDGTTETTSGTVLTFGAPSGTTPIDYTVGTVNGYVATPASGSVTTDVLTTDVAISFEATATVTLTETGLSSGTSWSATVGGVTSTSTTTSMTFVLPVGNYTYDIVPVSGYSSSLTHGNLTVTAHGYSFLVAFSGTSSATSYVPTKTFDPLVAIAIGLAAVAVVLGLLAFLRKPKAPAPAPATPWQEPPAGPSTTGGTGGTGH